MAPTKGVLHSVNVSIAYPLHIGIAVCMTQHKEPDIGI